MQIFSGLWILWVRDSDRQRGDSVSLLSDSGSSVGKKAQVIDNWRLESDGDIITHVSGS